MYWNLEITYCDREILHISKVHNDSLSKVIRDYHGNGVISIKLTKYYL